MAKIPLATLGLIHKPVGLLVSVAGVTFSVLLMFIETGFLNGVYDSQTLLVDAMDADLIVMSKNKHDLLPATPFPRRRLSQVAAIDGVTSVHSIYMEEFNAFYRSFEPRVASGIVVIGIDPSAGVLRFPQLKEQAAILRLPDTALIDARSRDLFGQRDAGTQAELNGRTLTLAGQFELGPNFRTDGFLLMSTENFLRYFPDPHSGLAAPDSVELGLVRIGADTDTADMAARIRASIPDDVRVISPAQFRETIKNFWQTYQPIGILFAAGAAVGFLIGTAICYQVLYTDVVDHLEQYATLKAMGAADSFLTGLVVRKAVLLSLVSFVIGWALSDYLYEVLQNLSGIAMQLTPGRSILILVLSVTMCVIAGLIAVRKAIQYDPAELY